MPLTYLIEHLAHLLSESGRAGLGDLGDSIGMTMRVIVTRWPMMISASWNYVYCPFISKLNILSPNFLSPNFQLDETSCRWIM